MTKDWRDAIGAEDLASIDRLIAGGADVDARDEHNQTAVMNAARDGHAAVVRLLVDRGAQLNHTAKYGLTALMLAVIRSHVDVVRVLVDAGANLQVKGTGAPGFHGKTALDLAEGLGSEVMVEIIRGRSDRTT